jgi:hypothetical protein
MDASERRVILSKRILTTCLKRIECVTALEMSTEVKEKRTKNKWTVLKAARERFFGYAIAQRVNSMSSFWARFPERFEQGRAIADGVYNIEASVEFENMTLRGLSTHWNIM